MTDQQSLPISIIIPTYQREQVLLDTIHYLSKLPTKAAEIIIVDQTVQHQPSVATQLESLEEQGSIRWIRRSEPSIPKAMNYGGATARQELVVFLDDDIIPEPETLQAFWEAYQQHPKTLIVGRVIQPWEEGKMPTQLEPGNGTYATTQPAWINFFMGCNFAINREQFLKLQGFDENFVGVAYNFEAEFAYRYRRQEDRKIFFEPRACIHHLKISGGGTRSYGNHLMTWKPHHAVGFYYALFRTNNMINCIFGILHRIFRAISTRHHLRRPWWIPATLTSEILGLLWAVKLSLRGPSYLKIDL